MTLDQAVAELRSLLGVEIAINITDDRYGLGDGYIADFSGKLSRVDDPVVNVDTNIHYFRLDDGAGFGIHLPEPACPVTRYFTGEIVPGAA